MWLVLRSRRSGKIESDYVIEPRNSHRHKCETLLLLKISEHIHQVHKHEVQSYIMKL